MAGAPTGGLSTSVYIKRSAVCQAESCGVASNALKSIRILFCLQLHL